MWKKQCQFLNDNVVRKMTCVIVLAEQCLEEMNVDTPMFILASAGLLKNCDNPDDDENDWCCSQIACSHPLCSCYEKEGDCDWDYECA